MCNQGNLFGRIVFVMMGMVLFAGCTRFKAVPDRSTRQIALSPVIEQQTVTVPIAATSETPSEDYLLGPNDVVNVTLSSEMEVANKTTAPTVSSPALPLGHRIDSGGFVAVPLVGRIKVGGLTTQQAGERVEAVLKKYYQAPMVTVELVQPKSQPLYLMGQFKGPGIYYMDQPMNLIQGMAMGHGPDANANLRNARLIRNSKIAPIDIYELLYNGDMRQNIWLRGGDTVFIPDAKAQPVYVFGAVKTPGPVPLANGQLSLLQALAVTGFGDVSYDHRVRIIRSLSTTRGELIVVDYDKIMRGEAMPFMLAEGDIVFVPKSPIGNWNAALNEILPTLQAVGAVLNPFVQLKFLSDN